MEHLKKCTKCLKEKPLAEFDKRGDTKCKLVSHCKACCAEKTRREQNKNKQKNRNGININFLKTCSTCKIEKDCANFYKNANRVDGYANVCKACQAIYEDNYVKGNKKVRKRKNLYQNNKRKTDVNFKLSCRLRNRLSSAVRRGQRTGSAIDSLGCSIDFLKQYLESKFQPGMTWDNWGYYGWHIDHIIPINSFDLSKKEELNKACHYTNLQSLWRRDNQSKSDRLPQQS